jgi:hypothetical protein
MILDYAELKSEIGHRYIVETGNIAHQDALRYITGLTVSITATTPNREAIHRLLMQNSHKDGTRLQPIDCGEMPQLREIAATVLANYLDKICNGQAST